ncbi:hypothetical protein ACQJBY_066406 [Aegilops geniculata]
MLVAPSRRGEAAAHSSSAVENIAPSGGSSPAASAIVAPAVSGSHVVKIDGYSRIKGLGNGKCIASESFTIGGHPWCMLYYPDGCQTEDADWISIFLCHTDRTDASEVKAEFKMSLLDQDRQPVALRGRCIHTFSSKEYEYTWGFRQFIKRKDLEESPYLKDDVFSIRFDVTVSKKIFTEPILPHVVVPPSNMHQHLGQLLLAGEAADVTFEVGGETFAAHRCISQLVRRSSRRSSSAP